METTPLLEDLWTHQHKTVISLGSFRGSRDRAPRGNQTQIYSYWLPADCLQAPITDATMEGKTQQLTNVGGRCYSSPWLCITGKVTLWRETSHIVCLLDPSLFCLLLAFLPTSVTKILSLQLGVRSSSIQNILELLYGLQTHFNL